MKRLLFVILCVCMAITSYANVSGTYQYEYEDMGITIVFDENTGFSDEERQYIANLLVYESTDTDGSTTYAWCWLTGHDITSQSVSAIKHKVYAEAPRCYMTIYQVDTCSNCDHVETTELSHTYLNCCPEE